MGSDSHIKDFIEECRKIDFSAHSANKDKNLETLKKRAIILQNEGDIYMKKTKKTFTIAAVAAALIIAAAVTAFGQDIVSAVRNYIAGDNIQFFIVDDSYKASIAEHLKGMVFDADGNVLDSYAFDEQLYDADGNEIFIFSDTNLVATIYNSEELAERMASVYKTIYDLDEALQHFVVDVRIPGYLPEGFSFNRVSFSDVFDTLYTEGADYMNILYLGSNPNESILCTVSYIGIRGGVGYYSTNKVTDSDLADPVEMSINGHKATYALNMLHIEIDSVIYTFNSSGSVSVDELIKIAESM